MEYLVGWGLLIGVVLILWLVIHFAGGEREEPRATCGLGGCSGSGRRRGRA